VRGTPEDDSYLCDIGNVTVKDQMDHNTLRSVAISLNLLLIGAALIEILRSGAPQSNAVLLVVLIFLAPSVSLAALLKRPW
jgi:hypothetical protein